jgi:opacity protein-like surface antigen
MKRNFVVVAVFAAILIPAVCLAAPARPGAYVSGFLGTTFPQDTDVTTDDFISTPVEDRVEFDPGIYLGGTGGYDFGMIRVEGELSYKHSEIKRINQVAPVRDTFRNIDGNIGVLAMMFNAFFDLHNQSPVTPYWGGGVGFATILLSDTSGTGSGGRQPLYFEDDDTVFAYQAGLGLEIALNPRLSLDLGYRYFGTSKALFDNDPFQTTSLKLESHNGLVGVRVKF